MLADVLHQTDRYCIVLNEVYCSFCSNSTGLVWSVLLHCACILGGVFDLTIIVL
jgi:hypothetical protein